VPFSFSDVQMKPLPHQPEKTERVRSPDETARYRVLVDDNFHYQDAGERYEQGAYATCADAVAACRAIVDACLRDHYRPGMTAAELWQMYTSFGDDPFIATRDPACRFSAWGYARARCAALAAGNL
jgi:hypothetical protein